jgi:hypothetical protein
LSPLIPIVIWFVASLEPAIGHGGQAGSQPAAEADFDRPGPPQKLQNNPRQTLPP